MTSLEHDELLTKCQIFEKETATRPEETNQRSQTESKETEHGGDESSYVIDSTVGQSFGEQQGAVGIEPTNYMETKEFCGAPRPSKVFKGTEGIVSDCIRMPPNCPQKKED